MKEDGTVNDATMNYEGTEKFSICFEGLASLPTPVCMYWDESKS